MANRIKVDLEVSTFQLMNSAYSAVLGSGDEGVAFLVKNGFKSGTFADLHDSTPLTPDRAVNAREQVVAAKGVAERYATMISGDKRLSGNTQAAIEDLAAFEQKLGEFIGEKAEDRTLEISEDARTKIDRGLVVVTVNGGDYTNDFGNKHGHTRIGEIEERIKSKEKFSPAALEDDFTLLRSYLTGASQEFETQATTLDGIAADPNATTPFRDQSAETPQEEANNRALHARSNKAEVEAALKAVEAELAKLEKPTGKGTAGSQDVTEGPARGQRGQGKQ